MAAKNAWNGLVKNIRPKTTNKEGTIYNIATLSESSEVKVFYFSISSSLFFPWFRFDSGCSWSFSVVLFFVVLIVW